MDDAHAAPAAPPPRSLVSPGAPPPEAWTQLRRFTAARLALSRTGGSVPLAAALDFRLAHARARDAVHTPFDAGALAGALREAGHKTTRLATRARDRATYLQRPDLGRHLDRESVAVLAQLREDTPPADIALIVSDGLSALAIERHGATTILALQAHLANFGWRVAPIFIVPFARVKLQDQIGELLGVRHTVMVLGERPGLGAPDSLGAYFTYQPRAACRDADRNCVSNIRTAGLSPVAAATKLAQLLAESAHLGYSGVRLKDTALPPLPAPSGRS